MSVRAQAVAVLSARKSRGVPWWEGRSLHLPSQALGLLGLALPRAHQPEVGSHSSITSPWDAGGCPMLHFASYQLPSSTER